MQKLVDFVYQLVCFGELLMAKLLRVKLLEKASILKQKRKQLLVANYLPSRPIMSTPPCLLDLKSTDIAEQMTLLGTRQENFAEIEQKYNFLNCRCTIIF